MKQLTKPQQKNKPNWSTSSRNFIHKSITSRRKVWTSAKHKRKRQRPLFKPWQLINNPTSLTIEQDVQPMSVSTQPTKKRSQTTTDPTGQQQRNPRDRQPSSSKYSRNQEDRQGSLPAASAVHTATNATADHYGIPYDLTFGPHLNTLSKMNIEPYTGYPLQWSDWRSRFDFMIGNTPLSNSQKIAYLRELVTGKAKDAILHFHCNGQFYNDFLERKFGEATTVVNAYIQRLLVHKPPIKGNPESYINYTIFIKGRFHNLQHLEHTADLESTTNLRHVIKKLPSSDLVRWQQYIVNRRIDRPNLLTFYDWLKPIAEAYELQEDNDNQQLQTFTTQTNNSKRSTSQSATWPLGDGRHQIFKCQFSSHRAQKKGREMNTRNRG